MTTALAVPRISGYAPVAGAVIAKVIVEHVREQCLQCTACGKQYELRGSQLRDPERKLMRIEQLCAEHAPCLEYAGDQRRARREHEYRVRMQVEVARMRPIEGNGVTR